MTGIIYSFKATGNGCRVSGRVCAKNMADATKQALEMIAGYVGMRVNVTQLANQALALKQWKAKEDKKAS